MNFEFFGEVLLNNNGFIFFNREKLMLHNNEVTIFADICKNIRVSTQTLTVSVFIGKLFSWFKGNEDVSHSFF